MVEHLSSIPGYKAEWETYEKNWFSTEAVLRLSLDLSAPSKLNTNNFSFPVSITVGHGPLILNDIASVGWFSFETRLSEEQSEQLNQYVSTLENGDLISASGYICLLGTTQFNQRILPFNLVSDEVNGKFDGASIEGTVDSTNLMNYSMKLGALNITAPEGFNLKVAESTGQGESDFGRMIDFNLMPSSFKWTLQGIHLQGREGEADINNIMMDADLVIPENKATFDMVAQMSFEKANISDQSIENATATISYKNISTALYKAYLDISKQLVQSQDQVADPANLLDEAVVEQALSYKPEFSLTDVAFSVPEGRAEADLIVSLKNVPGLTMDKLSQNPQQFLLAMVMQSSVAIDKHLVESKATEQMQTTLQNQIAQQRSMGGEIELTDAQIQQMAKNNVTQTINDLIQKGFIKEKDGKYICDAHFEDQKLVVNGQEIPLEAIMPQ